MRRAGFTILEVTLVLAMLLVLASITVPSIDSMYGEMRLSAAADLVRARWADARGRAVEDSTPYRFSAKPGTGSFRVAPDAAEFWGGGGAPSLSDGGSPLIIEDELPKGVTFSTEGGSGASSDGGGDWMTVVTFLPDATAREDVEITFRAGSGRPLIVKLRALTGAVSAQFQGGGG